MNIQYRNHPPYPNRWMITLIQQGSVCDLESSEPGCQEDGPTERSHNVYVLRPVARFRYSFSDVKRALIDSRDLYKSSLIFLGCHLFNMYRQDTTTLTHSFNLNDPHMQMSYF